MSRWSCLVALSCWLAAAGAGAGTVMVGETRTVEGLVSAVDVAHRSVVLEVPTPKGDFTVGVTLNDDVVPRSREGAVALEDVSPGRRARLTYTRVDGRLVGTDLELKR